jgi:hypothetical protein
VSPLTNYATNTYNNMFTLAYGFGGIELALFLATACLIRVRSVEERFRKIDEKRGQKGGFV